MGCWTNAAIDEVALFNVALPEGEIKSIMQNGLEVAVLAVFPADKLADTWGRIKSEGPEPDTLPEERVRELPGD